MVITKRGNGRGGDVTVDFGGENAPLISLTGLVMTEENGKT